MLGLIILPSAVLGVLSWRAIQTEKSFSLERLHGSYRQFAGLAARQIDYRLSTLESRWIGQLDGLVDATGGRPGAADVRELEAREPLITKYFLLAAPGRLVYPDDLKGGEIVLPASTPPASAGGEDGTFARLVARGEELEYGSGDMKAAIAAYRGILAEVGHPRLRAMVESYVGRAQLKQEDWAGAEATFRRMLAQYPEVRDLNRMYLRFLAQYQLATAYQGQGRIVEALAALLELNRDLLSRSDAITTMQFSYYADLIEAMLPRLLDATGSAERDRWRQAFAALGERGKLRISAKYFVHLLDAELNEMSFRRKRYTAGIRYLTARAEGAPFLLAMRALPDAQEQYPGGLVAAEIDLRRLQDELFEAVRSINDGAEGTLAILGPGGSVVIGDEAATGTLMASQALAPPFDSWQVAIYLQDVPTAMRRLDLRHSLWLWVTSVMLLSILAGGYLFILRARRQARLARAQTTFVSNVTHELRTPLASIRMFAELLELQMNAPPGQARGRPRGEPGRYLAIIRQECDRLNRLVDRVLDFSRMERDARLYRFEPGDVGALVTSVVESFRPYAETRGFDLRSSVDGPLPPVRLDADAISQVLLNLLSNAVQYSDEVKVIRVHVRRADARVAIDVTDRGIGIPAAELHRVFDKFYSSWRRMDDRAQGGLGLGLTLSREIVWAHGGEIAVRSEPGLGSTFTVTLPAPLAEAVLPLPEEPPGVSHGFERVGGQRG